mmetsp:Transcript_125922/g.246822  ORF Transcript_125922/g.246822 Transcript_125922/m.246822 type:complete len:117 (-) Transcript_125922:21-371(-)
MGMLASAMRQDEPRQRSEPIISFREISAAAAVVIYREVFVAEHEVELVAEVVMDPRGREMRSNNFDHMADDYPQKGPFAANREVFELVPTVVPGHQDPIIPAGRGALRSGFERGMH